MSVSEHRQGAPKHVGCGVLTVSDTRTIDTDSGGRAVVELLESAGHVVVHRALVRDDAALVEHAVMTWINQLEVDAIICTGGTGIARRDITCDALADIFSKELVGFGELFRMLSFQEIGSAAMLSRATAGVIDGRIVFLLPGSEAAVRLAMSRLIVPELGHIVRELRK